VKINTCAFSGNAIHVICTKNHAGGFEMAKESKAEMKKMDKKEDKKKKFGGKK
jgi:hypothetical protein